ncbi:uncharacterized protein CTRU02_215790 [Colletotrichum truncatum]|uniref:Uncharacterized protein n=1 Tax=Colletotrichum truncatum TaxID=5467 RepID=A0ACC3YBP8_COLTU
MPPVIPMQPLIRQRPIDLVIILLTMFVYNNNSNNNNNNNDDNDNSSSSEYECSPSSFVSTAISSAQTLPYPSISPPLHS